MDGRGPRAGVHNQMHMVHDFSLLAGGTPSTVAPEFDGTVNDADAASREPQVRLSLHPLLA